MLLKQIVLIDVLDNFKYEVDYCWKVLARLKMLELLQCLAAKEISTNAEDQWL